ncbi:MAG: hypothetical protein HYS06_10255 [Methylocystis sp.]|nr:hypothetical protein [Methylocystis sp.]
MMTNADVQQIVTHILQKRFQANGFSRSEVVSEEDFDGASIIRVTAHVERPVGSATDKVNAILAIQDELQQFGDNRFVYLDIDAPDPEKRPDEDEDDISEGN